MASIRRHVYPRDGFRCLNCGWQPPEVPRAYDGRYTLYELSDEHRKIWGRWLEIDHIEPICRGGSNEFGNLRTLCSRCNRIKGGR